MLPQVPITICSMAARHCQPESKLDGQVAPCGVSRLTLPGGLVGHHQMNSHQNPTPMAGMAAIMQHDTVLHARFSGTIHAPFGCTPAAAAAFKYISVISPAYNARHLVRIRGTLAGKQVALTLTRVWVTGTSASVGDVVPSCAPPHELHATPAGVPACCCDGGGRELHSTRGADDSPTSVFPGRPLAALAPWFDGAFAAPISNVRREGPHPHDRLLVEPPTLRNRGPPSAPPLQTLHPSGARHCTTMPGCHLLRCA